MGTIGKIPLALVAIEKFSLVSFENFPLGLALNTKILLTQVPVTKFPLVSIEKFLLALNSDQWDLPMSEFKYIYKRTNYINFCD